MTDDVRVYENALFSQKYFFPADWDVFVTFEPTKNYNDKVFTSKMASMKIVAGFQGEITIGDKAHIDPVYVAYDPVLIKYVEPSCTDDPS